MCAEGTTPAGKGEMTFLKKFKSVVLGVALSLGAGAALADPVVGVWKTEPDRKDLTSHIQISKCGAGGTQTFTVYGNTAAVNR